jgi:hypothetical protein
MGIGDDERRAAGRLVYPVIEGVLGALVDGEGHGSDESDAEEGRPNACICQHLLLIPGRYTNRARSRGSPRTGMFGARSR